MASKKRGATPLQKFRAARAELRKARALLEPTHPWPTSDYDEHRLRRAEKAYTKAREELGLPPLPSFEHDDKALGIAGQEDADGE